MKTRSSSQYFITSLLILLILVALMAGVFYTFVVGTPTPTPTPTASASINPTSSVLPEQAEAPQYPEQAHITDGIVLFGIILLATILFGVAWGIRQANGGSRKPPRNN